MTVTNPPLAPWQIEHIRKMQEELGLPQTAPDTEEVTMDQELNGQPPAEAGDVAGGLSVYDEAGVKAAMDKEATLAGEREAYYDKIAKALGEKRYGPSFSERMYQLSAAFAAPTSTRGFSGVMGNVMPVLAAQQKAQREGEISRREALEQLEANRLTNKLGLARQDTQTKIALARINATARKSQEPKLVYADGAWRIQPGTGDYPTMPTMDQFGNYVITDRRQLEYLPPNTPVVEVGQDPMKPKYVPDRANPDRANQDR
jgi:hypothetical protein